MAKQKGNAELSIELNAVDNVSETTKAVEKRISTFERAFSKTGKGIGSVLNSTSTHFTAFSVAAAASMTVLRDTVVNPLKGMLTSFSQTGYAFEKMARNARLTVESLGAIGYAAEQTGSSMGTVASAMNSLQSKMEQAGRGSLSAMQDIYRGTGLLYQDLQKLSPEEQFLKIADVIQKVGTEADKAEIARRIFGTDELLPLLKKGAEGVRALMREGEELGGPWSKENLEKSKLLAQSVNRIKTIIEGIKTNFMTAMTEPITDFLTKGQKALQFVQKFVNDHPKAVKALGTIAGGLVGCFTAGAVLIPLLMGLKIGIGALLGVLGTFLSPWVLIPTLLVGAGAGILYFTGLLGPAWQTLKDFCQGAYEALSWFFGDSINLLMSGDFEGAWANIWAKTQIVFIEGKQKVSQIVNDLWNYLLETTGGALNSVFSYLDKLLFNGNEVFGKLYQAVKNHFSKMLGEVGANSSSISEVFLAGWFSIQKGFYQVWYGIQETFFNILGSIQQKWISFRKEFQAGINWMYGKLTGLSDEEIAQMTVITDREYDQKAKEAQEAQKTAMDRVEARKTEAIEAARKDIQARIQAVREQPQKDDEKVQALLQQIEVQKAVLDPSNPESPAYQSGIGEGPANFLREQMKDASKGTQNSFQAMFGFGQTTEQKQLEVSRQILNLFQILIGNVGG